MASGVRHFFSPDETEDRESSVPSPPSWIRLLDPARFPENDVTTKSREPPLKNPPDETSSQPETAGDSNLWYMSPFFNKPVIGYYNRITQSNLSLVAPPLGGSGVEFGGGGGEDGGGWLKENVGHTRELSGPVTYPQQGEQSVYSELYTPWMTSEKRQSLNSSPPYLQHRASNFSSHDNQGFLSFGETGSGIDGVSPDRPEVLKPEEYLSGLQTETYSVLESPRAPCGRWTRVVVVVLVLMALTIVGLATALTVSVLTKTAVVRASMTLKILNKNYSSDMADPTSGPFNDVATAYSLELDRLFLASPLAAVYRGNKVTALSSGSISARTELLFLDTGLVTKGETVQSVIKSAERASQWDESDARAMGQFVVCSDCVTVSLNFTHLSKLPPKPVLQDSSGSEETVPSNSTSTPRAVTQAAETSTVSMPNVLITNSTPFLSDGHFAITCDVTKAGSWTLLTLEFRADNSSVQSRTVLVTVGSDSPSTPSVIDGAASRISAFSDGSSDHVTLFVNVTDVTCEDRGNYLCRVTMKSGQEFSHTGRVEILELPSPPVITWSSTAWDATPAYTCSAKLGYPPGALSFSVANDEHSPWERLQSETDFTQGGHCREPSTLSVSVLHPDLPGNGSRLVCQVFSEHLQLIDPSKYSAVLQLDQAAKLEIQTKSTSVDQGLAVIRCRLFYPPTTWSRLVLLKLTSQGPQVVTSLRSDGSVMWTDNYFRHRTLTTTTVSEKMAELSVFVFSVKCADEAVYACGLNPEVSIASPEASLHVAAKPRKPLLNVPDDIFQRSQHPYTVTCKAKVGRPAGSLVLAVKHPDEADFRELSFNEQTTIPLSCTTEVRGTFYAGAGSLHNGSSVSCSVVPHSTMEGEADAYVVVRIFNVLPDALCQGQLQERNVSHPTDCHHVINCKNDVISNVHKCPDDFCFNKSLGVCSLSGSFHSHTERPAGPCYPDKDHVTLPHPGQCTAFIQCHRGHKVTQHCPTGHLYVTRRHCSSDVTRTQCYKDLRREIGVVTNVTFLASP
ncbi:hypothetical protein ACOMHN_047171 [Nucella lapillus]